MNLISAGMVATKGSQDLNIQLMLFCTTYTNYNHKLPAGIRKMTIAEDKFKGLALRRDLKVSQEERKRKDKVLVSICFGIEELVLMLIIN